MKKKKLQGWMVTLCALSVVSLLISLLEGPDTTFSVYASEMSRKEAKRLFHEGCQELDVELQEHPDSFDRYGEIAGCLAGQGQWTEALPYYLEELERRPHVPFSYHVISNAYYNLGRHHKAIHEARRGLSLDRNNPVSHYNLAFLLEEVREWNEALSEYREVFRWVKEHGEGTLYNSGYSTDHLTREKLQAAIQRLKEKGAKEKAPEERPLPLPERKISEEKAIPHEQYAHYCQEIKRQVEARPRDPRRQLAWAFCRIHAGDLAGAEVAFLRALEQDASNPYNYLFLAAHYQRQGKHTKAISELRRGLGQRKFFGQSFNPVTQYLLARAYEAVGRFKEARILYLEVAKYAEKFPEMEPGKHSYLGYRGEWYPMAALTPGLIQARLAYVEEQIKGNTGEEKQ